MSDRKAPDLRPDGQNPVDIANHAQALASDPRASVFVSASAGSGKTKLLIDRLLRLMLPIEGSDQEGGPVLLEGSDPARILCLTYTKAAAAEMANRLQMHLGRWVGLSDDALDQELHKLHVPVTEETRRKARSLFLKVLDLPGGLRIETIHAFCQSLLRRFPLEAALDPHFTLMEEGEGHDVLRQALEETLAAHPDYATNLAAQASLADMVGHIVTLSSKYSQIAPLLQCWQTDRHMVEKLYRHLLHIGQSHSADIEAEMCVPAEEALLRSQFQAALPEITESQLPIVEMMVNWLALAPEKRNPQIWQDCLFTGEGKLRAMGRVIGKKGREQAGELVDALEREALRQQDLLESRKNLALMAINKALIQLAAPVLLSFQKEKSRRGVVDYNDLITYTRHLLREPGAAWVLYKLDGGIDHLLLDEVQDTSARQWEIAGALTEDFFAGQNGHEARPRPRTIFAVGDFKQSIYSFQGAEPEQFRKWRDIFRKRVQNAGLLWREPELNVSFRSVQPVLSFVDAVFSHEAASVGVYEAGQTMPRHLSARPGQGGRVALWPLMPEIADDEAVNPWVAPRRNTHKKMPQQRLADSLADWIGRKIGHVSQKGMLPLQAGEIMVLVPRRSPFVQALIRALKSRNIPVANFLSAVLTEHIAVRDMMTLCAALLLPQDSLSLASVLTSPWGGVSDDSLMDLATDNGQKNLVSSHDPLWNVLRRRHAERPEWQDVWERFSALYRRVDYDTPYALLVQALGQYGGRARFLARLGAEAVEPVDELLALALDYEAQHIPSLQGFLHWLQARDVARRREAETTIDAVRLMTAHGSKGLQARLVILPDTMSDSQKSENIFWAEEADHMGHSVNIPLWVPRQAMATAQGNRLKARRMQERMEENNRLLYVALTRASDELVICGWGAEKEKREKDGQEGQAITWYSQCRAGFERLCEQGIEGHGVIAEEPSPFIGAGDSKILIYQEDCLVPGQIRAVTAKRENRDILPSWLGRAPLWRGVPAVLEEALARPLAPSRPEGMEFGPQPVARSPLSVVRDREAGGSGPASQSVTPSQRRQQAMQRGRLVHRLLQLLPGCPSHQRDAQARAWLSRPAWGLSSDMVQILARQVVAVLEDARLAPLFAPGSCAEQAISGLVSPASAGNGQGKEGRVVLGRVDRFAVQDHIVWLCDYKTGRRPPQDVQQTPPAWLRQMAAYRAVMADIYPGHEIRCFLIWTEGPEVSLLPQSLLEAHQL